MCPALRVELRARARLLPLPVLRVDPAQLDRLEAIAASLQQRIAEAEERGWAGEVEHLTISLRAAQDKILATAPPRDPAVLLGYPTPPEAADGEDLPRPGRRHRARRNARTHL